MSQQRDYKVNFWLGVGAIVGILMVLLLLTLKKQGMDIWAGFIFGAFGGILSMVIFLPAWVDRYRSWKAPTSEDIVKGATDGEGEPRRARGRSQGKKDYLIAVQIGLGGIVAAALMVQIGALRFFGYGDLGEQLASSVGVIAAGTCCLALFIPKWAEKIRRWWHLESEDRRASEQGRLFRQLEHEQAAREAAELELMELRQQQGTKVIAGIKDMLRDDEEYRSLLERAEKAERMVESLDSQAREQAEKIKRDSILIKELAERLESTPAAEQPEINSDTSLAFPYATKQLEAMRDAAATFWQAHDRSKPAPHGIQKQVQLFLSDRIGSNERKATELANAIKPDDLPEK